MTDRSKTVVLLIDWDNLQICHNRDAPGTEIDLQAVIALAQSYGTLVSSRAYAEWNMQAERLAVYKAGIEPVFAPVMRPEGGTREGKSLADTVMVADGVDLLWTVAPDVFVLVTSDKDMIPLARIAKQRGAAVVVLGSDLTAIQLVEMSNVFITYRQLLRELDRTVALDAPVGRAPARERRHPPERGRPSGEPIAGRGAVSASPRGPARPSNGAAAGPTPLPPPAPALPAATAQPAPALSAAGTALPTGEGEEDGDASTVEGMARRRRRRGGRSRGRGAGALGTDQSAEPVTEDAPSAASQSAMLAGLGAGADESDVAVGQPAALPPTPRARTPLFVSPISAPPSGFSEFGPPPAPPPTELRPPAVAGVTPPGAGEPIAVRDDGEAATDAAPSPVEDLPSTALAAAPTGDAEPIRGAGLDASETVGPPAEGAAGSEPAENGAQPDAEEQPAKPVRRRRTRAATRQATP